ncbi:YkgJ family cysteine cluster protein [Mangrovibacterium sp.]|uniref:YkgJ family cysteine cluster protein n=1 Tax=Mangrovibacterium sp. TaxID=1961364 RepID=UPI0035640B59
MAYNFSNYHAFIANVDRRAEALEELHKTHMKCKKGCDLCCMNYQIFPVEYFAIEQALKVKAAETMESTNGSCVFLKNHYCQIYESRPFICRTHGLPLLFMNDEQWELSVCELNFTEFDDEEFSEENTLLQDKFNSELFLLNKQFIADNKLNFSEFDLLEMKDLHRD